MAEPPRSSAIDAQATWRQLSAGAERVLSAAGLADPGLDSRRLVERASGMEGAELVLGLDAVAPRRGAAHLRAMVERRAQGEPLQYVVGSWGFRSLDLMVDARVLIPRPETEQVTEVALAELRRHRSGRSCIVVDLGTGSGAIALAVAVEVVTAQVWATDVAPEALAVARANLAGIGRPARRVRLAQGDWFSALPETLAGHVDVVVANPPYVPEDEELPAVVADWEPFGALMAGPTGLEHLERIVAEAPRWLARRGSLVLEFAPHQAPAVADLARSAGFAEVEIHPDLAGRQRALVARR